MKSGEDAAQRGDSCFAGVAAGPALAGAASLCPAPSAPEASLLFGGSEGDRHCPFAACGTTVSGEQAPLFLSLPTWTSSPVLLRYEHSRAYAVFPEGRLDTRHWKQAEHKLGCLQTCLGS